MVSDFNSEEISPPPFGRVTNVLFQKKHIAWKGDASNC